MSGLHPPLTGRQHLNCEGAQQRVRRGIRASLGVSHHVAGDMVPKQAGQEHRVPPVSTGTAACGTLRPWWLRWVPRAGFAVSE